ncbi:Arm DNA-binding domain-containing protein [Asticcacaulis currens]|uniref:Arm DNA-binding domain-containing protein n=1 Tax=Asticcacaulis currens TaxID=2984210 RepID=UPI0034A3AB3F
MVCYRCAHPRSSACVRRYPGKLGVFLGVRGKLQFCDTPQMALTDSAIRSARPKAKPYKLSDGEGMFLLVTTSGGKLWRLKYRFSGQERLLANRAVSYRRS